MLYHVSLPESASFKWSGNLDSRETVLEHNPSRFLCSQSFIVGLAKT